MQDKLTHLTSDLTYDLISKSQFKTKTSLGFALPSSMEWSLLKSELSCSLWSWFECVLLNLPLWANFYNYTDLSLYHFRPTNPIGWPQPSTRLAQQHRLRRVEAEVEAKVEAGWGLAYLAGSYWMTSTLGWGKLRTGVQIDFDLHSEHITA